MTHRGFGPRKRKIRNIFQFNDQEPKIVPTPKVPKILESGNFRSDPRKREIYFNETKIDMEGVLTRRSGTDFLDLQVFPDHPDYARTRRFLLYKSHLVFLLIAHNTSFQRGFSSQMEDKIIFHTEHAEACLEIRKKNIGSFFFLQEKLIFMKLEVSSFGSGTELNRLLNKLKPSCFVLQNNSATTSHFDGPSIFGPPSKQQALINKISPDNFLSIPSNFVSEEMRLSIIRVSETEQKNANILETIQNNGPYDGAGFNFEYGSIPQYFSTPTTKEKKEKEPEFQSYDHLCISHPELCYPGVLNDLRKLIWQLFALKMFRELHILSSLLTSDISHLQLKASKKATKSIISEKESFRIEVKNFIRFFLLLHRFGDEYSDSCFISRIPKDVVLYKILPFFTPFEIYLVSNPKFHHLNILNDNTTSQYSFEEGKKNDFYRDVIISVAQNVDIWRLLVPLKHFSGFSRNLFCEDQMKNYFSKNKKFLTSSVFQIIEYFVKVSEKKKNEDFSFLEEQVQSFILIWISSICGTKKKQNFGDWNGNENDDPEVNDLIFSSDQMMTIVRYFATLIGKRWKYFHWNSIVKTTLDFFTNLLKSCSENKKEMKLWRERKILEICARLVYGSSPSNPMMIDDDSRTILDNKNIILMFQFLRQIISLLKDSGAVDEFYKLNTLKEGEKDNEFFKIVVRIFGLSAGYSMEVQEEISKFSNILCSEDRILELMEISLLEYLKKNPIISLSYVLSGLLRNILEDKLKLRKKIDRK